MRYAVTGANGYVGSRIADYLETHGSVRRLTRKEFSLGQKIAPNILKGIDVLVHCAYDFSPKSWKETERVNVQGSLALFAAAHKKKVLIIFISSMSAFEGCKSRYGQAKLAIEDHADVVIRPGLVWDEHAGSIMGTLQKLHSPIIPIVGAEQRLYLCHSEDLARLVERLAQHPVHGPVIAAAQKPYTIRSIIKRMHKALLIPVPAWLASIGLNAAGTLHLTRLRSDSLTGLLHTPPRVSFTATRKTGIRFRQF